MLVFSFQLWVSFGLQHTTHFICLSCVWFYLLVPYFYALLTFLSSGFSLYSLLLQWEGLRCVFPLEWFSYDTSCICGYLLSVRMCGSSTIHFSLFVMWLVSSSMILFELFWPVHIWGSLLVSLLIASTEQKCILKFLLILHKHLPCFCVLKSQACSMRLRYLCGSILSYN